MQWSMQSRIFIYTADCQNLSAPDLAGAPDPLYGVPKAKLGISSATSLSCYNDIPSVWNIS